MVDWAASPAVSPAQIIQGGQQGSAFGYDMGQKLASLHALQGVDLANPGSVNQGLQASIHAGNMEQANALLNINMARTALTNLPSFLSELAHLGQPSQAAPAQAADNAPQQPTDADHIARNQAATVFARDAADELRQVPEGQRMAYLQNEIAPRAAQIGIPAQMVSAIGQQLALDTPGDDDRLKAFSDHQGEWMQHAISGGQNTGPGPGIHPAVSAAMDGMAPNATAQPEGAPQTGSAPTAGQTGYGWTHALLQRPDLIGWMNLYKKYGVDLTGMVGTAQALETPYISQQAASQYAGPIAQASEAGKLTADINLGQQAATATAKGSAAGGAPFHPFTTKMGGKDVTVVQDENGVVHPIDLGGGDSGTSGPGAGGTSSPPAGGRYPQGRLGVGLSPQEQEARSQDAAALVTTKNNDLMQHDSALRDATLGEEGLNLVSKINTNPAAPYKAQLAQWFTALPKNFQAGLASSFGLTPQQVNNYAQTGALFDEIMNRGVLAFSHQNLPSKYTEAEQQAVRDAMGTLATPQAKAEYTMAMQVAIAHRDLARSQYAANYKDPDPENPSNQDYQRGWQDSVGGRKSLFQDPIWQRVMVGGQPMVQYVTVKGQPFMVIGAGLGGRPLVERVVR